MFFFNDTATTEIYTLSLHDALPICWHVHAKHFAERFSLVLIIALGEAIVAIGVGARGAEVGTEGPLAALLKSEEDTAELQSRQYLRCRLLLEKKKTH